ncbi:MAG: sodium-translocating pyrophosphatase [Candidatus Babeliales bacterium]
MTMQYMLIFGTAVCGILFLLFLFRRITHTRIDDERVLTIGNAIDAGAVTFLREEYTIIALVIGVVAILLWYALCAHAAIICLAGACCSLLTGYIGMRAATRANMRTAIAAKNEGEYAAFMLALYGGGVMGVSVATIGMFGLGVTTYYVFGSPQMGQLLVAFSLGASIVAFFVRIGGGIYTKSADVGADLVGKVETGIPEDDPRNPAVIADNVGDCVGDTAGMGADMYESYIGAMVSAMILAKDHALYSMSACFLLPLMLAAIGLMSSLSALFVSSHMRTNPACMLRHATYGALFIFGLLTTLYVYSLQLPTHLLISIIAGCCAGMLIGLITEYYTAGTAVERVAESARCGAATNVMYGLSVGMESTALPVLVLLAAVLIAHTYGGGPFGVALAAVAMLATVGITMTVDAYGPIVDNAAGIAQMAGFGETARMVTDKLDALGNTTAAIGKGFAVGSALLTALALFTAYAQEAAIHSLNMLDPLVMVGIFIGACVPFVVAACTMRSVSKAALHMVMEVRRQFQQIPGLMEGTALPDYTQCIAISTRAALHEMLLPGCITLSVPVLVFYTLGVASLGGLLIGAIVSGVMLALMMANAGGVWDNAKKYIEAGNLGGKGSETYKAAMIGDMIGDPFKDASGPSLNILIKLMAVIALLLVTKS